MGRENGNHYLRSVEKSTESSLVDQEIAGSQVEHRMTMIGILDS